MEEINMQNGIAGKVIIFVLCLFILTSCGTQGKIIEKDRADSSGFSADQFMSPSMQYRPGVRWWWPGAAADTGDLLTQIDYLADNGFGAVEIVAFNKNFISSIPGDTRTYGYKELPDSDQDPDIEKYDSEEYYAQLEAVIKHAAERGIIVDLNAGSGYDAGDDSVSLENGMGNMALGRKTITISENTVEQTVDIPVPEPLISSLYIVESEGAPFARWYDESKQLNAVIIARIVSTEGAELIAGNVFF